LRQREQFERLGETPRAIDAARHLQRDDGAKAALLALRHLVPGMSRESRVVDALDVFLLCEVLRHRLRIPAVLAQAHVQRAQTAQREEAVEGRTGESQAVAPPP